MKVHSGNEMSGFGLRRPWARSGGALVLLERLLQCSACCKLLQEPVCLGGCEHVFCRSCVADSIGNGCPVCHAPAWVQDLQPNRQMNNMIQLCSQLRVLLDNKGSTDIKAVPSSTSSSSPQKMTDKKRQMRMWFSPRSRKMRCVLDMNLSMQDKKSSSSILAEDSSSVFEFLPSPPHLIGSPKKKAPPKSKQTIRKRLVDANKVWGFGKIEGQKMEKDDKGCADNEKIISFCSQPEIFSSPRETVTGEVTEESILSFAPPLPASDASSATTSKREDASFEQLHQTFEPKSILTPVTVPRKPHAKRSRKRSDSSRGTTSKKSRQEDREASCLVNPSPNRSMKMREKSRPISEAKLPATPEPKPGRNETVNGAQTFSLTNISCHTPTARCNSEKKQRAVVSGPLVQKSPCTPQMTPKTKLSGRCTTPQTPPVTPTTKKNHKGETLLHLASIKGDVGAVEQLLENGADPNIKDNAGWTPLHEACNHGHAKVAELLLQYGALLNTPGYQNDSPLHDAVRNRHVDVVKLLISHRAAQEVVNIFGLRPVDYADSEEMITALQHSPGDEASFRADQSFVVSMSQRRDGPILLLGSGLHSNLKKKLEKLAKLLKAGTCTNFSSSVTHVIVPNDNNPSTMKCLMGILSGCWILNIQWVTACLENGVRVAEEDHEIISANGPKCGRLNRQQQLPGLFDGCYFYFMGSFKIHVKEDLVDLVKVGGGQVLARQPKPDSDVTQSINTVAYHAHPGSDQSFCTQYIIYDKDSNFIPEKVRLGKVWSTCSTWLIDCVKSFELLSVTNQGTK
eukprot:gi/632946086/ref/XP_007888383.1/ PREDICTED: BRCA1-associated RING domain protein 1 [Callorhinchus milii]